MMICGFYNTNPFTPASLAVVIKGKSDNHQIIYPDGHSENLNEDEFRELEGEFVKTRQKSIRELSPTNNKFILLPDGKIIAGSNLEVCYELVQWYKNSRKELDSPTRVITEKYIVFLLGALLQSRVELETVEDSKILTLFVWFLKKTKNEELGAWLEPFEIQRRINERVQKLRDIGVKFKVSTVLNPLKSDMRFSRYTLTEEGKKVNKATKRRG